MWLCYNDYATCILLFMEKRLMDCKNRIIKLRESTGLNRKDFCKLVHIPYRTMTEWELDNRHAPDYVLRLLEYYIPVSYTHLTVNKANSMEPTKITGEVLMVVMPTSNWVERKTTGTLSLIHISHRSPREPRLHRKPQCPRAESCSAHTADGPSGSCLSLIHI